MGIAIGGPAPGVEGFRRAHEEAGDAYVVARRMGRRVASYGDVSIEALAIQSEASARRFVAHALGDLGAHGRRHDVLRETLRVYYRRGQNGAATAKDLGVHEQTVARRLASAAQLLGAHPAECRAEVEAALRIREIFSD
jgi:DNA-binding PucR family transcriptional regulator